MPKKDKFDDETILSTPNPIHSSSISENRRTRSSENFRRSREDESFPEAQLRGRSSDAGEHWRRECLLASNAINRLDSIDKTNEERLMGLPSRFLRPSDISTSNSGNFIHSESTISESDLLMPGNSSTPRESMLSNMEYVLKEPSRQSRGSSISRLASSVKNTNYNIDEFMENFRKTMDMNLTEATFFSGDEAIKQMEKDEISWKHAKQIPSELKEFSVDPPEYDLKQQSMGSFFKQRSDNLTNLLAKSPEKVAPPIALIDSAVNDTVKEDSLSISAIARILSDTQQTPVKAANYFLNPQKRCDVTESHQKKWRQTDSKQFNNTSRRKSGSSTFSRSPTLELCEAEASKENVDTLNIKPSVSPEFQDKSAISSRSSSALSNLPNGKLPIATTKTEIIWGCVKPGKNASQDFIIKNKSARRIGVVCTVSNPSFRLIKEGSEINLSSTLKVNLHPYETRNLMVTFAPTTSGAAVDCLQFSPMDSNHQQLVKQHVKLFGYGGYGNVIINNIIKDTSGKFLLSLGNIDSGETMTRKFVLKNIGTLPSFAQIGFVSSGLHLFSSFKVTPQVLVLLPDEEKEVVVTYEPKKDDVNFIQSKHNCVIDVGKLAVTSGTEADRGRLRRLYKKATEKGIHVGETVQKLVDKFPGEVMPNDLKLLKESIDSKDQILRLMNTTEVVITLEQDLDRSVAGFQNETAMFHSLCENTLLEYTIRTDSCSIEPSKIILKPPSKISDMIFITNNNQKQLYFEIYLSPEGLIINPKEGTIGAGETLIVHVTCGQKCNQMCSFKVKVLVESESFDVDVKVVC